MLILENIVAAKAVHMMCLDNSSSKSTSLSKTGSALAGLLTVVVEHDLDPVAIPVDDELAVMLAFAAVAVLRHPNPQTARP